MVIRYSGQIGEQLLCCSMSCSLLPVRKRGCNDTCVSGVAAPRVGAGAGDNGAAGNGVYDCNRTSERR